MNNKKQLLAGPYLVWIIGFILLPLVMIVYYAFTNQSGDFTLENILAITNPTNLKAIALSLKLGVLCTLICLLLSYPLAMILNGLQIKRQSFIVFIFMLPMWMNFMLRILAWKQLLTKSGRTATKSSQNPGGFARSLFLLNTVKYNCQLENTGIYKGGKHNERHEHYR